MTSQSRRAARLVAGLALCVYISTAGGSLTSTDAVMTYEVTKNLVEHGSVAASYNVKGMEQHRGVDGRFYAPFGIGQSLFNIPFYLAGHAAQRVIGIRAGKPDTVDKAAVALGNTVAAAGIVWVVFLFAWRLSGSMSAAIWTTLSLAFGTLVWPYSKFGFNALLTTWCLTAGIYAAWLGVRSDRRACLVWSGVWLACAFLTRHEIAIAILVAAAWVLYESRRDGRQAAIRITLMGVAPLVGVVFWFWFNFIRFGNPFNTGYAGDSTIGFDSSILTGMYGLLFSPGRSLFVYVPLALAGLPALFALARRDSSLAALFTALVGSLLVFYSSMPSWEAGRSYGPRYLVPILPFLITPIVWWLEPRRSWGRRGLIALALFSVLVQLPGILVDYSKVSVAAARAGSDASRQATLYSWRHSGLILNTHAALTGIQNNVRYLANRERPATMPPSGEGDDELGQRLAFSLDFWWLYLYFLGALSASAAIVLGAVPLLAGSLIGRKLWSSP